jgi:hypothetical protein
MEAKYTWDVDRGLPLRKGSHPRCTRLPRGQGAIDRVLGFEEHFVRGQAEMEARVTLALVVMLAMALRRIRANQAELTRSLTAKVRPAA